MTGERRSWSAAWEQFLIAKRRLVDDYQRARDHSLHLPVATHHGVVGEASVRAWLESFLPKRFGVTSGYIRAQRLATPYDFAHFDVIIYDQLEAPTLWLEANSDKSSSGRTRIIPAEHVHAVIEVKSSFSRATARETVAKLRQLEPLMAEVDAPGERYPTYLRRDAVVAAIFMELRKEHAREWDAVDAFVGLESLRRPFYGAIILSGEGLHADEAGMLRLVSHSVPQQRIDVHPEGLLGSFYFSEPGPDTPLLGAMLHWNELSFSDFAFDLLAIMRGTYEQGRASSWHGLDMNKIGRGSPPQSSGSTNG